MEKYLQSIGYAFRSDFPKLAHPPIGTVSY